MDLPTIPLVAPGAAAAASGRARGARTLGRGLEALGGVADVRRRSALGEAPVPAARALLQVPQDPTGC